MEAFLGYVLAILIVLFGMLAWTLFVLFDQRRLARLSEAQKYEEWLDRQW